jgi:hypothetical protein
MKNKYDRDEKVEELTLVIAKARSGPGMTLEHNANPLPSWEIAAKMFVDDHIEPLNQEAIRLREVIKQIGLCLDNHAVTFARQMIRNLDKEK